MTGWAERRATWQSAHTDPRTRTEGGRTMPPRPRLGIGPNEVHRILSKPTPEPVFASTRKPISRGILLLSSPPYVRSPGFAETHRTRTAEDQRTGSTLRGQYRCRDGFAACVG